MLWFPIKLEIDFFAQMAVTVYLKISISSIAVSIYYITKILF